MTPIEPAAATAPVVVRQPAPTSTRFARLPELLALYILLVGVALRLHLYVDRRSLWLDEIWIALNIVGRTFVGLTRPLDYAQSAPVGFLWLERLAVVIGGANELALRAFPLLAGCLLLAVVWSLGRRLLDVRGAALCLALAALSPLLIYYSNEVKPYVVDAFVTSALTYVALELLDAPDSPRAWRRMLVAELLGLLLSTPCAFVLAAVGSALATHPAIRTSAIGWRRLLGTGAVWLLLFTVGYLSLYRSTASSFHMQDSWSSSFLVPPLSNMAQLAHGAARTMWIDTFVGVDNAMLPRKFIAAMAILTATGALSLWRRRGLPVALLLVLPFVVTAGASYASLWPLTPRLLVFLIPILALLLGTGLWTVAGFAPARVRGPLLAVLGALMLMPGIVHDVQRVRRPVRRDDAGPLIRAFMARPREPAIMYVVGHATPTWLFYTVDWRARAGPQFRFASMRARTSADNQTRACLVQEPGLRVAFSPTGPGVFADSSLAVEAAWIAEQPERDAWVFVLRYEHEAGHDFDRELLRHGAMRVDERSRQDAELRRYRFPARRRTERPPRCTESVAP
ncbi:MAG TPA: glycosyltransferase family 39 protein [Gemmatimonadaceae bacterium]|nr:glycosyltransferase family 39 protein [Gemmatimonadaceae bacterium]